MKDFGDAVMFWIARQVGELMGGLLVICIGLAAWLILIWWANRKPKG